MKKFFAFAFCECAIRLGINNNKCCINLFRQFDGWCRFSRQIGFYVKLYQPAINEINLHSCPQNLWFSNNQPSPQPSPIGEGVFCHSEIVSVACVMLKHGNQSDVQHDLNNNPQPSPGGGKHRNSFHTSLKRKAAFTLAEILITLGIIGVISALVMPILLSNYREIVYITQFKKMVSIVDNMLINLNNDTGSAADTYRTCFEYNNIDLNKRADCFKDIFIKYSSIDASTLVIKDVHPVQKFLYFPDGSSLNMTTDNATSQHISFQFDVNGDKKPNKAGIDQFALGYFPLQYDKFISITYNSSQSIKGDDDIANQIKSCKNGYPGPCTNLIVHNGFKVPKYYPLKF